MRTVAIGLTILLAWLSPSGSVADEPPWWMCRSVTLQVENDFFVQAKNTDRHYTNGMRLSCLTRPLNLPGTAASRRGFDLLLPELGKTKIPNGSTGNGADQFPTEARSGIAIGHSMFTPDRTEVSTLETRDRPYAGWLYLALADHQIWSRKIDGFTLPVRQDTLQLELGVVGPAAGGAEVQNTYHDLINVDISHGWSHQLRNEPGVNLVFERKARWMFDETSVDGSWGVDAIPQIGLSLGNVSTYLGIGGLLRFGNALHKDFGPPRIRPSLAGSERLATDAPGWIYGFVGFEARAVARNIFLDGNTFQDSHHVSKKPLVIDTQLGLAAFLGPARLAIIHTIRSREFHEQDHFDHFGAVTLTVEF